MLRVIKRLLGGMPKSGETEAHAEQSRSITLGELVRSLQFELADALEENLASDPVGSISRLAVEAGVVAIREGQETGEVRFRLASGEEETDSTKQVIKMTLELVSHPRNSIVSEAGGRDVTLVSDSLADIEDVLRELRDEGNVRVHISREHSSKGQSGSLDVSERRVDNDKACKVGPHGSGGSPDD